MPTPMIQENKDRNLKSVTGPFVMVRPTPMIQENKDRNLIQDDDPVPAASR